MRFMESSKDPLIDIAKLGRKGGCMFSKTDTILSKMDLPKSVNSSGLFLMGYCIYG